MTQSAEIETRDQGQRAFLESTALLECLREACRGDSAFSLAECVPVLDVLRERIGAARAAFDVLTGTG